jgi:peptidoglycan/xylan/chitin deacetylase (PgdA/CDA1 family)
VGTALRRLRRAGGGSTIGVMPPLRHPRLRPSVVALGAGLLLVGAIALLLRADSGHGQGRNQILPPPATATVLPARGSCLVPARAAERFGSTTRRRVVALTFDDGPGPETAAVLARLRRAGQHATFFVIGRQIAGREAVVARAAREGDAVGNHTWDHADVSAGDAAAAGELLWTSRAIRRVTGRPPCVLRAPYGRTGPGLVAAARQQGMVVTEWSVDPQDWRSPSPARTARAVLSAVRPGAIILLHDGGPRARETRIALPRILRGLQRRGYRSLTVPQLLHLRRAR